MLNAISSVISSVNHNVDSASYTECKYIPLRQWQNVYCLLKPIIQQLLNLADVQRNNMAS